MTLCPLNFQPEGLKFAFNATLTMRYNPVDSTRANYTQDPDNEYEYSVHYLNPSTEEWEYVGGDADEVQGLIRVDIAHFSSYAVMRVPTRASIQSQTQSGGFLNNLSVHSVIAICAGSIIFILLCWAIFYYYFNAF